MRATKNELELLDCSLGPSDAFTELFGSYAIDKKSPTIFDSMSQIVPALGDYASNCAHGSHMDLAFAA